VSVNLPVLVFAAVHAATLAAGCSKWKFLDLLIRERNTAADNMDYPYSWLEILSAAVQAEHSLPTLPAVFLICCCIQCAQAFLL